MKIGKLKKAGITLLSLFMIVGLFTSNVKTIEAVESDDNAITINMFNYDAAENSWNGSTSYWNQGINSNHALKFTDGNPAGSYKSKGNNIAYYNLQNNDYNVWVKWAGRTSGAYPRSGMVENVLGSDGYPILNDNSIQYNSYYEYRYTKDYSGESLAYLFNTNSSNYKSVTKNVSNLFTVNGDHYSYDSDTTSAKLYGNTFSKGTANGGFWPYGKDEYHFGMTMSANFTMTNDGTVTVDGQKKDMVFNFSGDDDVWVFIDGVLILDLGGIHDALSGEINFKTGEIKIQNGVDSNGNKIMNTLNSSVADLMSAAGLDSSYYQGNTLSTSVMHSIDFFYLERGKGGSNCKLDMYLPFIKTKDVTVSKELEGINEAFKDDYSFDFETIIEGSDYGDLDTLSYKKYSKSGTLLESSTLQKKDGKYTFELKDDQYIILENIVDTNNITVTETGKNSSDFYTTINGTSTDDKEYSGQVEDTNNIEFVNTLKDTAKGNLLITKTFNGDSTKDIFNINVKINNENYEGTYSVDSDSYNTTNGNISIQNKQTVVIKDIPNDYSYNVSEMLTDEQKLKYFEPEYENSSSTINRGDNNVNIINKLFTGGKIEINKYLTNINNIDFTDGDPVFTFEIKNNDTNKTYYQHIRFYEEDGQLKSTSLDKITKLEAGTYTITELSSLRYKFTNGKLYYNGSEEFKNFDKSSIEVVINTSYTDAKVEFYNTLKSKKYDSDNGVLVNKFVLNDDKDGCNVKKDKLGE